MSLTVRQERMRLLALASVERLEAGLSAITPPDYEVVRGPETGVVMIRGRVGSVSTAVVRSSKRRTRRPSRWWRTLPNCRPCPFSRRAFPLTPTVPQPSCLPVWPLMREPVSVVPAPASAGKVPSPARCPKILRSGGARIRRASRSAWTCCCAAPTAWPVCRAPRALNVCLRRVRHVCSGQRWGKGHFRRP